MIKKYVKQKCKKNSFGFLANIQKVSQNKPKSKKFKNSLYKKTPKGEFI